MAQNQFKDPEYLKTLSDKDLSKAYRNSLAVWTGSTNAILIKEEMKRRKQVNSPEAKTQSAIDEQDNKLQPLIDIEERLEAERNSLKERNKNRYILDAIYGKGKKGSQGRRSTILTGPSGLTKDNSTNIKKSLLT